VGSFSGTLVILELPFVSRTVGPRIDSFPGSFAILERALVSRAVRPRIDPLAVRATLFELTLVFPAVGPGKGPLSGPFVILQRRIGGHVSSFTGLSCQCNRPWQFLLKRTAGRAEKAGFAGLEEKAHVVGL
jgi:hypothetical protein